MSSKQFIRNTMATIQGHHSPQLPQITRIKSGEPLPASPLSSSSEDLSDPPSTQTKSNQPEEQAAGHNLSDRLHRASSMVAHHSPEYGRASPTSPARSKSTPLPAQKNLDHDIETMLRVSLIAAEKPFLDALLKPVSRRSMSTSRGTLSFCQAFLRATLVSKDLTEMRTGAVSCLW